MKKTFIGCLSAAVIIIALAATGIWYFVFRELPTLETTISLPLETRVGSTVTMVITATNAQTTPVVLDSIDIDDSFLSGFQVVSVDPKPGNTMHVPLIEQRSWEFGKSIDPNGSLAVTFSLKAVEEGRFTGDVDVCNPTQDFTTQLADIIVKK